MMEVIEKDVLTTDDFMVTDVNGNIVTGLVDGNFTKYLYNPSDSEVWSTQGGSITELGNGAYKITFTPNAEGTWMLIVVHATYFAAGKVGNYQCLTDPFPTAAETTDAVWDANLSDHTTAGTFGELVNMLDRLHVNKFTWDANNSRFELYNQSDSLVGYLNVLDKDSGSVVLQGTGPAERSGRVELV